MARERPPPNRAARATGGKPAAPLKQADRERDLLTTSRDIVATPDDDLAGLARHLAARHCLRASVAAVIANELRMQLGGAA